MPFILMPRILSASRPAALTGRGSQDLASVHRTVFQQEWWLDAATGGEFREVDVRAGHRVVGWLPYITRRRWGFLISEMPFLTHTLGPLIAHGADNPANELLRFSTVTCELMEKLPKLASFRQVLPPGDASALGFVQSGCHARVQFTFVSGAREADAAWKSMRDKTRNVIRRSADQNDIVANADVEEFRRLYADSCRERGIVNYYDDPRTTRVLQESAARGQGRIYVAREKTTGKSVAGIVVVWDERTMYFLMSTRLSRAHSGAVSQLLWEAMQEAQRLGIDFDFDGAPNKNTAKFLAGFGCVLARRQVVQRFDTLYHALDRLRAATGGSASNPYSA